MPRPAAIMALVAVVFVLTYGILTWGFRVMHSRPVESNAPPPIAGELAAALAVDAASRAALRRMVPHGDGTRWCFEERACGDDRPGAVYSAFRFSSTIDSEHLPALCLDLVPCTEVPRG